MAKNSAPAYAGIMHDVDPEIAVLGAPGQLTAHSRDELKGMLLEGLDSPIADQSWPEFLAQLQAEITERSRG